MEKTIKIQKQVQRSLILFITLLTLSGITAFPIETQLEIAASHSKRFPQWVESWIEQVNLGVKETNLKFPFLAYGTDWLAFAHIVIAIFFIGPIKDPVRNIWIIKAGMIACLAVFALALVSGPIRGIPFWWQLIDCSFGFFGFLLLQSCFKKTQSLIEANNE